MRPSKHPLEIRREAAQLVLTCGAPRVHAELRRLELRCSRKRVARLMRDAGLVGARARRRWREITFPVRPSKRRWPLRGASVLLRSRGTRRSALPTSVVTVLGWWP